MKKNKEGKTPSKMSKFLIFFMFMNILILFLFSNNFQQTKLGVIKGKIIDEDGNPMPGITVELTGNAIAPHTAITGYNGIYRFLNLPHGVYSVKAELEGFKIKVEENISLQIGETKKVDIIMEMGTIEEEITVTGETPITDTDLAEVATDDLNKTLKKEIEKLSFGKIVYNPPKEMMELVGEIIEARISHNVNEDLTKGLEGRGIPIVEPIKVSTTMKARLSGKTFNILELSDKKQVVSPEEYAEWEWEVTPQEAGDRKLYLSVSVIIDIPEFGEKKLSLPVMKKVIYVKVNPDKPKKINWYNIIGMITAIILAIVAVIGLYLKFRRRQKG